MPEGDTIWRTARTLHAALAGKTVLSFTSSLLPVAAASRRLGVVGQTILAVEARGKHLLVRFSGGAVLHTHQGMRGSWRLERQAGGAGSARTHPRARIETADVVAVCLLSPVVEVLSRAQAAAHPALSRLGPDLLGTAFDPMLARRRLRARGDLPVGVALMDQTALAGIGNVYKSRSSSCAGSRPSHASATSTTGRSTASWRRRGSSCAATSGPARAGRHRPCRPCGSGSTGGPGSPAAGAGPRSSASCRASRPARRTSARPASAERYFPRSVATDPSTPAGGCSSAKRSSSCSSARSRASVALSSAATVSCPGWP